MHRFRPAESIQWAVEIDGVVLIDSRSGRTVKLAYPQAALWDFMVRGDSLDQMTRKMALVASIDSDRSEIWVEQTIAELVRDGFIEKTDAHG
jgi:hypothetical protein